jgi:prefoldin subunit 5
VVGGPEKAKPQTVARPTSKSVSNMDLNETSQVLDDKIRQLQRDQMELELLKREVDKKLKN